MTGYKSSSTDVQPDDGGTEFYSIANWQETHNFVMVSECHPKQERVSDDCEPRLEARGAESELREVPGGIPVVRQIPNRSLPPIPSANS